MGVVALSVVAVSCNSETKAERNPFIPESVENINIDNYKVAEGAEMDSVAYTLGANMGLQSNFGLSELEIDSELLMKFILDTYGRAYWITATLLRISGALASSSTSSSILA